MRILLLASRVLMALSVAVANPQDYYYDDYEYIDSGENSIVANESRDIFNDPSKMCGIIQNQTKTPFLQDTIFVGPYTNVWVTEQCPYISIHSVKSISECKVQCTRTQNCTAFNINFRKDFNWCNLRSCPWPVPLPVTNSPLWQGYAIAESCDTNSKCALAGGFCIPAGEACNGDTLKGRGYCNANYYKTSCECCLKPTVYMRDIENTIAYALRNRAPYNIDGPPPAKGGGYRTLNTTEQEALLNYTQVLEDHIVLNSSLINFFICLRGELQAEHGGNVTGQELNEMYITCEQKPGTHLPQVREWIGCKNFDLAWPQQFRSYPCGVWITFHAITIDHFDGPLQDAPRILPTLHSMVDYFPWCDTCKDNFIDMYNKTKAGNLTTAKEVTTWLWSAHNQVSLRIAIEKHHHFTPNRPKSLFPDFKLCPVCWEFVDKKCTRKDMEVLSYLKKLYNATAIVPDTDLK